ncbi:phage tail tube protein, partial [Nostoc sp. NIES-2111]
MPEVVKGRNCKVEIASAFSGAKVVSAISNADPGVATSTAHALLDGVVGFFSNVGGMVQLEGQAARVDNPTANNFELQGLNTTGYSASNGNSSFTPASAWLTISEATSYQIGGGAAEKLDTTTLIDVVKQEENGLLATQSVQIGTLAK